MYIIDLFCFGRCSWRRGGACDVMIVEHNDKNGTGKKCSPNQPEQSNSSESGNTPSWLFSFGVQLIKSVSDLWLLIDNFSVSRGLI